MAFSNWCKTSFKNVSWIWKFMNTFYKYLARQCRNFENWSLIWPVGGWNIYEPRFPTLQIRFIGDPVNPFRRKRSTSNPPKFHLKKSNNFWLFVGPQKGKSSSCTLIKRQIDFIMKSFLTEMHKSQPGNSTSLWSGFYGWACFSFHYEVDFTGC